ncbi:hypothetical protein ACWIW6_02705 [Ursidibacter sp. B-7004-1]
MKPNFKTATLVVFVSLGIAACGSSGNKNSGTSVTTSNQKINTADKGITSPQTESSSSTPEKTNKPEESSAVSDSGKSQNMSPPEQVSSPKSTSQNNQDNSWRKQYISLGSIVDAELMRDKKVLRAASGYGVYPSDTNEIIDYDKLANGKLGYFSGVFKPEGKSTANIDSVNYAFINQPYSTYAIITSDAVASSASITPLLVAKDATKPVSLTGSATYKGQLIGSLRESLSYSKPELDGTAEIQVNFNQDKATMSGVLNSNLVGKIILPEISSLGREENGVFQFSTAASNSFPKVTQVEKFSPNASGSYYAVISGDNANDVVGNVSITDLGGDASKHYFGAFGGTKQ